MAFSTLTRTKAICYILRSKHRRTHNNAVLPIPPHCAGLLQRFTQNASMGSEIGDLVWTLSIQQRTHNLCQSGSPDTYNCDSSCILVNEQLSPVRKPCLPAQPDTGSLLQNGVSRKCSAPCVGNISSLDRSRWKVHVLLCQKCLSFSCFPCVLYLRLSGVLLSMPVKRQVSNTEGTFIYNYTDYNYM